MSGSKQKRSLKEWLILALKFGIVIGALVYLIWSDKLDFSKMTVAPGKGPLLGVTIVCVLLVNFLSFLRYSYLLKGVGAPLPVKDVCRIGMIGAFFNIFMLGGLGGDVIKLAYVIRETGKRAEIVASVMIDRILGLIAILSLGGIALLISWPLVVKTPSLHGLSLGIFIVLSLALTVTACGWAALTWKRREGFIAWGLCGVFGVVLCWLAQAHYGLALVHSDSDIALLAGRAMASFGVCWIVALVVVVLLPSCQPGRRLEGFVRQKIPLGHTIMQLIQAVLMYKGHARLMGIAFFLSLLLQCIIIFAVYATAMALQLAVMPELSHIFFATPPTFVANAMPIPGGGLGVGEGTFGLVLSLCRTSDGSVIKDGANIFLVFRLLTVLTGLLGLPLYLIGKKEIVSAEQEYLESLDQEEKREEEIENAERAMAVQEETGNTNGDARVDGEPS